MTDPVNAPEPRRSRTAATGGVAPNDACEVEAAMARNSAHNGPRHLEKERTSCCMADSPMGFPT